MVVAALAAGAWIVALPDRAEIGPRRSGIEFEQVEIGGDFGPFQLRGAWRVSADDPRFGGVSALAIDGGELVALTDSGAIVRFDKPETGAGIATIDELPAGPGAPAYKSNRDSEALARDPLGRGWWVAFERSDQLWLYDREFDSALARAPLDRDFGHNSGIETLVADGSALLLIPEPGRDAIRIAGSNARTLPIQGPHGRIADGARLPDGRILLVERTPTPLGFANAILSLSRDGTSWRVEKRIPLPLGPLDNVEAMAAERAEDGALKLWLMTDDNYQRPLRTLLIALELRPGTPG